MNEEAYESHLLRYVSIVFVWNVDVDEISLESWRWDFSGVFKSGS